MVMSIEWSELNRFLTPERREELNRLANEYNRGNITIPACTKIIKSWKLSRKLRFVKVFHRPFSVIFYTVTRSWRKQDRQRRYLVFEYAVIPDVGDVVHIIQGRSYFSTDKKPGLLTLRKD